jgi:hypothetical protein
VWFICSGRTSADLDHDIARKYASNQLLTADKEQKREEKMRKYLPLRPQLYAQEVETLILRLASGMSAIDLHVEAERIAERCGMSAAIAHRDFVKTRVVSPIWQGFKPAAMARSETMS